MPARPGWRMDMPAYYDEKTKTWFCKFYYTDYTGVRRQKKKRGFKLQREVKEWERAFLEKQQGTPDMTFQALYDICMEDMGHRLRPGTIRSKESTFRNRILPFFADKPVNTITPSDIRAWQNTQIDAGLSDGYLSHIQDVLTGLSNYAVRYHNLPSNPCSRAGGMGKPSRSMAFWTLDQYDRFIQHVKDIRARTALDLLFYSGVRCGELLALTLGDFDFQENMIGITKTRTRRGLLRPRTVSGVSRCPLSSCRRS